MVMTFEPVCNPIDATLQFVVPRAVPLPPRLFVQATDTTPTLSEDVPPTDTVATDAVYDAAEVGLPMEIVGGVVSDADAEVTDHVKVCATDCSTPSKTLAVTLYVPAVVAEPETNPVAEPMKSPGGRPVAV
jgi:hypothetical protein